MRAHGKRTLALSIAVGLVTLAAPSSAGAATQIGETFVPSAIGGDFTFIQSGSLGDQYAAPFAGVITSWSFQANPAPPQLKFKVARPAGGNSFTIIGESGVQVSTPNALNTFPVQIPVQAGDVIGLYKTTSGAIAEAPVSGYTSRALPGDVPPGTTASAGPGFAKLDVSATLEPDADNDGFGDETQDQCPTDASTQGPCPDTSPPNTTITKGPKDKTKKKQATFEFTSSEPGSTFQCTLDGQTQFKACTSPLTVKVKKGKHSFQVQATDQAGNADASPASDDWKRKKKKKK